MNYAQWILDNPNHIYHLRDQFTQRRTTQEVLDPRNSHYASVQPRGASRNPHPDETELLDISDPRNHHYVYVRSRGSSSTESSHSTTYRDPPTRKSQPTHPEDQDQPHMVRLHVPRPGTTDNRNRIYPSLPKDEELWGSYQAYNLCLPHHPDIWATQLPTHGSLEALPTGSSTRRPKQGSRDNLPLAYQQGDHHRGHYPTYPLAHCLEGLP